MTDSIPRRYERLAAAFGDTIGSVSDDQWSRPSPCEGWTARDVLRHVVDSHGVFLDLVGRSLPEATPAVDDDPAGAFAAARGGVQGDLDDPAMAEATYDGVLGRTTFAQGVDAFLCFDLNVHRWDLGQAVGVPVRLDPAEVARLRRQAEGFGDALRGPGWFGPQIELPDQADDQAKLLAFLGRRPGLDGMT